MKNNSNPLTAASGNRFAYEEFKNNDQMKQIVSRIRSSLEAVPSEVQLSDFTKREQLAYWLNLRVLSQISPVAAMSSAFMIPLFGVAWGHLFLGEPLGSGVYLGGAFVLLATALVTGFNPLRRFWPAPPVA